MNILERLERNSTEQRKILNELWYITQSMDSEFTFTFHGHYNVDRYSVINQYESHYVSLNDSELVFDKSGLQSQSAIDFLAELNNKIGDL